MHFPFDLKNLTIKRKTDFLFSFIFLFIGGPNRPPTQLGNLLTQN